MIEQLIQALANFWEMLRFWHICDEGIEGGFVRKLGRPAHDLKPGINWVVPFLWRCDTADLRDFVALLEPQSVETSDSVACVLRLKMTYRVADVRAYWAQAYEASANIQDVAMGELGQYTATSPWADVQSGKVLQAVSRSTRAKAKRWGIEVEELRLVDCARAKSMRLWQSQTLGEASE